MAKKTVDKALEAADTNGDGHISMEELEAHMNLEFKRKELEDADAQRDAIRKMAMVLVDRFVIISVWNLSY